MRQLVRILRLALIALCGLLVAVALIPAGGAASGPPSPAVRDATVTTTDPATSTDPVCDGDPACDPNCDGDPACDPGADPCFDDDSCDSTAPNDPSCLDDDSCDSTTPDDPSCTDDDSCDSTTPDDPSTTATTPSGPTISQVLRRGYLDAGWITLTSAGWMHATLTQPGSAHTARSHADHTRRHHASSGSTVIGRGHATAKAAGQVHLIIHLTAHGRHVLRTASGPLRLTLRTTIKLRGEHASTSTASLVVRG